MTSPAGGSVGRAGGVLLHPTSLPGGNGIGDLGPAARVWIEWLRRAGCRLWQFLPLGPTGYADSPYQSLSAFAGNPLLISLEDLIEDGLLEPDDLGPLRSLSNGKVNFGEVNRLKPQALALAADRSKTRPSAPLRGEAEAFYESADDWLNEFALFMALKDAHDGVEWTRWAPELASRKPAALARARRKLQSEIERHRFYQFLFFRQWARIRRLAEEAGIHLIGDVPIFVAHDSADVWAEPELFHLDERGMPTIVAGVPPDYFSPTGQLWGNPLYRWGLMRARGYAWWTKRLRCTLELVHRVRLDHFRGFEAYWEIPGDAKTAIEGRWVPGPGADLLNALKDSLGGLPLIAEDLGVITPEVTALRESFNLPGMKVLHFAFGDGPEQEYLPHNYPERCVVYTGTHDNDTSVGWFGSLEQGEKDFCRRYLQTDGGHIAWDLIRAAWSSVAQFAIAPIQDLLELGSQGRMNTPGVPSGNWDWRLGPGDLTQELADRVMETNYLYGRV